MSSFDGFLESYRTIRRAEGWGAANAAYYRTLPQVAANDPQHSIWQVRAASFSALLQIIGANRRVLDLGAGNGWLAYQLARRGHSAVAVDVNDDESDGLGARRNYPFALSACRADFRRCPWTPTLIASCSTRRCIMRLRFHKSLPSRCAYSPMMGCSW